MSRVTLSLLRGVRLVQFKLARGQHGRVGDETSPPCANHGRSPGLISLENVARQTGDSANNQGSGSKSENQARKNGALPAGKRKKKSGVTGKAGRRSVCGTRCLLMVTAGLCATCNNAKWCHTSESAVPKDLLSWRWQSRRCGGQSVFWSWRMEAECGNDHRPRRSGNAQCLVPNLQGTMEVSMSKAAAGRLAGWHAHYQLWARVEHGAREKMDDWIARNGAAK